MTSGEGGTDLLYVSWGGTGRAASFRQALRRAVDDGRALRYLAVLDDGHFADLDDTMLTLVRHELEWLLTAQLDLTRTQVGAEEIDVSIEVRAGRVVDAVAELVEAVGAGLVLIGAPVPVAGHETVDDMVNQISSRTGRDVEVVLPRP